MFEQLLRIAKENLMTLNETVDGLPAPQVTVLLTANNTIYVAVNDVDGIICEKLVKKLTPRSSVCSRCGKTVVWICPPIVSVWRW